MKKRLCFIGLLGCLTLLNACDKEDEEIAVPSGKDRNWFVIENKPGELNQLLYEVYRENHMSIFVNDTIGIEIYAEDHLGNPIFRTETFNIFYQLFGTPSNQGSRYDVQNNYIRASTDTAAMILAVELIRDKVLPYLPEKGKYRPKSYLLLDSLKEGWNASEFVFSPAFELVTYNGKADIPTYVAMKGVAVGGLCDICEMSEDEQAIWAGRIVASKIVTWINDMQIDKTQWEAVTKEGNVASSLFSYAIFDGAADYAMDLEQQAGMFYWFVDRDDVRMTVSEDLDLLEMMARVYAYRGREDDFLENYMEDSKIYRKFLLAKNYVEDFEAAMGIVVR